MQNKVSFFKELESFLRLGNNSPQIVKPAREF